MLLLITADASGGYASVDAYGGYNSSAGGYSSVQSGYDDGRGGYAAQAPSGYGQSYGKPAAAPYY